jgi:NAD(P)-dependent dehydrogenase (short-subunit alcohol dehydrogenase family)
VQPALRDLIDDLLEVSVVGSFSALGYEARRRLFGWTGPPADALAGRTVLLTGPTSGLGRRAADELAALGARLVLVGRSEARLAAVRDALVARHADDRFPVVVADMASLASVRAAVETISASEPRLDVVIDNAGAIFPERTLSADGIEATLATMVIGPFALVSGLLPLLRRTGGARVIAVTSGGMYAQVVDRDDLGWRYRPFSGPRAYAQAKRIQVALIREWARRIEPTAVAFQAMHPGWADTPGLAASLPGFHRFMGPILRTPAEGVDTLLWLVAGGAADEPSGGLYHDRRRRPFDRIPATRLSAADRRDLWEAISELAGMSEHSGDP